MRALADEQLIRRFMRALGAEAGEETAAFLTGGATAVIHGWRSSTVDIDLVFRPERDDVLRALPRLKEALNVNVELVSPADFIPVEPGWEERGEFVAREGKMTFYNFDLYAQALAKAERGHARDLEDVRELVERGLVERRRALDLYEKLEPELFRFPAVDPAAFRARVEDAFGA